jgi:hypothetical protein
MGYFLSTCSLSTDSVIQEPTSRNFLGRFICNDDDEHYVKSRASKSAPNLRDTKNYFNVSLPVK